MAEQVQSGPQQSRARRFLGAGKRTLDGEDRSERIKTGRKGTPFRAFSPTIKPEFPLLPSAWSGQSYRTDRQPSVGETVSFLRALDAGNPHVQCDEREQETELCQTG